ncbi:T9SS type A sorting domain-containing protein [Hymenobacter antarcticus]|uniref:Por secretion system C-terminal sorting domain-containing protein n=1 Tax=Hymenobacter antarcticus TaxID=486270 RepID=A0ABP7Q531_9BACT
MQLTLSWIADNDNGLTDFTQARVWQQTAAAQPWAVRGPVANASARNISMNPATLSRFTVSNAANPLPVTLLDFAARAEGSATVRLNWATAQELNNLGFVVERSLDARSFSAIGTVAGAGTSSTRHDYQLLDAKLPGGVTLLYYRLRQNDLNGSFSFSPVRSVALVTPVAGFAVYPTQVPVGQASAYRYTGPAEPAILQVLDLLGRVVRTAQVDGRVQGSVPLAGLSSGSYLLRYTTTTASFGARCTVY